MSKRRCMGCMQEYEAGLNVCPHCGYIAGTPAEEAIHMNPGTLLHDRYIIGKVLGFGGFGVTYIGWDGMLERRVAVKEYLPGEFSTRMPGQTRVTVFNGEKSQQFNDGLNKFVDEAKRLAKFQNEDGIVRIYDSFTENETAYIIMEYLEGETLTEYLKREGTVPEDKAVEMLVPVMRSLQAVHAVGLLHRDIAPDNIFLTKTGEVKLIDFGASRYATTSRSRSLTVIIKQGYSPEEQYRSRGDQGPYTDVYAIAATLYKMLSGKTPPDAMERRAKYEIKSKDILVEPHKLNKNISVNRENAILNAMNVRIEDRTPDIKSFIDELNADPPAKRRYGKIKKIDLYHWPLWTKIALPALLAAVLTIGVLLATGIIDFSKYTSNIVVPENIVIAPDVEGYNRNDAIHLIESNNLLATTGGTIESQYVEAGTIIVQQPVGGSYMEKNTTVILTISSGYGVQQAVDGIATIPNIIWDTEEDAIAKLLEAGLGNPQIERVNDETVAKGQVISTSIETGTKVDEGTVITIVVSLGPASFPMPYVIGKICDEARAELESKGLAVTVAYETNNNVPEGHVISQSVDAGTDVKRGNSVTIVISSGRPTIVVEDVSGKNQNEAEEILRNQGFNVVIVENYSEMVQEGYVISQTPAAGTKQTESETITICVSKGAMTTPTPDRVIFNDKTFENAFRKRYGYTGNIYISDVLEFKNLELGDAELKNISDISNFKNVNSLTLWDNNINDISALKSLTKLKTLEICYNNISDISALKNLTQLTELCLGANSISDISVLKNLSRLTSLELGGNNISDISILKNLKQLKQLDLRENPLTQEQIEDLEQALPNCLIISDYSSFFFLDLNNTRQRQYHTAHSSMAYWIR